MKILSITLLAAGLTTGIFASRQAPIPPQSAQDYIKIKTERVQHNEAGLTKAKESYMKLMSRKRRTPEETQGILLDLVNAIQSVRIPYAALTLADPTALTPEESQMIEDLNKREKDSLAQLKDIEQKAKSWAEKNNIEYPKSRMMF